MMWSFDLRVSFRKIGCFNSFLGFWAFNLWFFIIFFLIFEEFFFVILLPSFHWKLDKAKISVYFVLSENSWHTRQFLSKKTLKKKCLWKIWKSDEYVMNFWFGWIHDYWVKPFRYSHFNLNLKSAIYDSKK